MANKLLQTIAFSSNTNEWHTPGKYIEAARTVMGHIDLDPASNARANLVVRADLFYTSDQNGLKQDWFGRVWLNPPYGKIGNESSQGIWSAKLMGDYYSGKVKEGIVLLNLVPGYNWFRSLWSFPVCIPDHCISFIPGAGGGKTGKAKVSSCFFYIGHDNAGLFCEVFKQFGVTGKLTR